MKKQNSKPEEAANLRRKAEERMKLLRDKARLVSSDSTSEPYMLKLIHELEVHQIELEMQNEELIIAKEKAELAEEKYTGLYDFAPSGYIALSKKGEILELNLAAANMLGMERAKLIKKRFDFFVSIDARMTFNQFLQDIFTGNKIQTCEVSIATEGNPALAGQVLLIYVNINGIVSQNNEYCLLTLNDITDSILAKKELLGSQEKYRISEFDLKKAQQIAHLGNWVLNIETNELLWSDEIYRIFDCDPHEFDATYEAFIGFVHPDDRETVNSAYLKSLDTKTEYQIEHRIITKNSQLKYVQEKCTTTFNEQGKPLSSFGIVIDITAQKALENELIKAKEKAEESENKFRTLSDNSPAIIYRLLLKPSMKFVYVSPVVTEITGYTPEDHYADPDLGFKLVHPDDRMILEKVMHKTQGEPIIMRWVKKDGKIIWTEQRNVLIFDTEGHPFAIEGIAVDITLQKEAELALRMNEELLNASQRLSKTGGWEWNVETQAMYWTEETYRIHDLTPDEVKPGGSGYIKLSSECYHPEDRPVILAAFQRCLEEGQPYDLELPFTSVKGRQLWIRTSAQPVIENGKTIRIIGNIIDITDRKVAEQLLQDKSEKIAAQNEELIQANLELITSKEIAEESEERFRHTIESSPIPTAIADNDGNLIYMNKQFLHTYGYTLQELSSVEKWYELAYPDPEYRSFVQNDWGQEVEQSIKNDVPTRYKEYEVSCKNGEIKTVSVSAYFEKEMIIGLFQDITERKLAEAELKNSREASANLNTLLNAILESPQDMVVFALDNKYCYTAFTKAHKLVMKSLWGVDIKVGDNMLDYLSRSQDRNKAQNSFGRCLQGEFFILEEEYGDSSLQRKYYETRYSPLFNKLKEIIGLTVFNIDITERKLMEDTQAFLLQISNPGSDENFFESLAKYLAQCLEMEYVCIDLLEGDKLTAKTLAIYNEGNFDPNVSYALKDTPCGEVVGNHICCYPQEVRSLFPNDAALEDIKAESYIGTTLWSFDGQPIGLIAVIGQKPLQNQELAASVLKLVSLRAAGKLEATLAVEKVRESEKKYRQLVINTDIGFVVVDDKGNVVEANDPYLKLAGFGSFEEISGHSVLEWTAPDEVENNAANIALCVKQGYIQNFETVYLRADGTRINIILDATIQILPDGKMQNVAFCRNITERKQSEAIIRDIIEKNPMSIQILDMEGYPIQVNPAHTKLFGVEPPSDYSIFKDSQLLSLGFDKLFDRIKNGEVVFFPDSYYNVHDVDPSFPDSPAWVRALGFTLNDNNGKPNKIVLMHENITERKDAEALLNDIIKNNPLSIQVVDKEGYTLRGNPAFVKLFGSVPPPEFSIFDDLKSKNIELENLVSRVKNGEMVLLPDIYFNAHDSIAEAPDIPLWIRALIFPLKDSSGKPERFVLMHENITERKFAEQELIKAKEHAEESDRLKSAFLANMSHEIRTPMNGILGFSELLKEPGLTGEQQQEYIRIIEKSGARMLNIINDIVDISKIEAGLMKPDINKSNVNEQIEYIYTFFKPEVEAKGMKFTFRNSLTTKEAFINTDREKLYAILTNLVKNAIKYTKKGSIEFGYNIETRNAVETRHALSLQFYVKDTGIGIPQDRQEAIFERFIQADIEDRMARQGAGLGLAITKAYIEMLGGKIWVESEEGAGSTFYFTLPYITEQVNETIDRQLTISEKNNDFKQLKILIAEDDEVSGMLIGSYVKMFGKEIFMANTGFEALEACHAHPDIDLILMDIRMPEMSGYEAVRKIREFNAEVIIIAQTAHGLSGDREKALASGCNDYIAKPVNKNELQAMILKYFRE